MMRFICSVMLAMSLGELSSAQLSGPLSGTLGPGDFQVIGNISVDSANSLTIMPNTILRFQGMLYFSIYGTLTAMGTATDSIQFISTFVSFVYFESSSSASQLAYCVFQGTSFTFSCSSAVVAHSAFRNGRIGIQCSNSYASIASCMIEGNSLGGVICHGGAPQFSDCIIRGNSSTWFGGGVDLHSAATFTRCLIYDNQADWGSGVACWEEDSSRFINCTISLNTGDYVDLLCCECRSVFSSCIISSTWPGKIDFAFDCSASTVEYCDVPGWFYPAIHTLPPGLFQRIQTNARGDSCDIYFNIRLDPQFVDRPSCDVHLQWNSPCIDAGDPDLPRDPDGTVADIGALYRDIAAVPARRVLVPMGISVMSYPNPFNSKTNIRYDLPVSGSASLCIFDLLGREVAVLREGFVKAGTHAVEFDGSLLPSGVYFVRLDAEGFSQTKKLVLLK